MPRCKSATFMAAVVSTLGLLNTPARAGSADNLQNFAVFGNTGVNLAGFNTLGEVGSNASINAPGSGTFAGLRALGSYNGSTFQTVTGGLVFGGSITGGGASSYGSVDAGGNVSLQDKVLGNVTAGQNLVLASFVTLGANAYVGGNATFASSDTVTGTLGVNGNLSGGIFTSIHNLIAGGSVAVGNGSTITTQSHGTLIVQPQPVSFVPMPVQTEFVTGGSPVSLPSNAIANLAPGHYGALNLAGVNTLNLSSGSYYFDSIQASFAFNTLNLDLTGGAIDIFVAGNVDLNGVSENINGVAFGSVTDPAPASQVYLEAHGSVVFDDNTGGTTDFFGTIYAPDGPITTRSFEAIDGQLLSGQGVSLGSSTDVTYEPSTYLAALPVPEPASTGLAMLGGALLIGRRRRR